MTQYECAAFWTTFVTRREDVVGVDSSIVHNPTTVEVERASGRILGSLELVLTRISQCGKKEAVRCGATY